jgi:two-component system, OmpR family, sensor histidine kinase BaeS
MLRSLWVKFLIILVSVSMISLASAFLLRELIIRDFQEYLEGGREDRIYKIMASIEGSYEKYSGWKEEELNENIIWALLLGYECKIMDTDNKEIINTNKALESLSPLMKRRILALSDFSFDERIRNNKRFAVYPLFLGGKNIGHLDIKLLSSQDGHAKETIFLKRSNRLLIISIFALGGLSVLLSFIFSRRLTDPVKKLTIAAKDISEGNIKSRVPVSGNDEIGKLSVAFNAMADNLEIQESLRKKLMSNIAHELRTPLTSIQGELEGMIDGLIKVDRERLLSLNEEAGRLKTIIEGIEELSIAEASALELRKHPINMKPFLVNIKDRFENLYSDKGVELELECEDNLTFHADPDRLSQIVINLLSNALKATEKGGGVQVKAGIEYGESFIEIKDTGQGMRKEEMPFIFERFYKVSEGGLGLGLTIAKELAEAHGGRIEVQSEYGKGSVFTVYIPEFTTSS